MKRTALKRHTPLKAHKGLIPISPKQKAKNELWNRTTDERAEEEHYRCQWCHKLGNRNPNSFSYLNGHHKIKRRYNIHTKENCYVVHEFKCHGEIEDNNVDVRVYPDREAWERRDSVPNP